MKLPLTPEQVTALAPYFDRVRATAALGTPGILVAQLRYNSHRDQHTMEPCFIAHEHALLIAEKGERDIPGLTRPVETAVGES